MRMGEWQPIETAPDGEMVLLSIPDANRGNWGCEVGMMLRNPEDPTGRGYSLWSNGGPNGGSDLHFDAMLPPTHWMPLPAPPNPAP